MNSNADALSRNPISESRSEDGVCCCDGDRGFNFVSCGCDDRCGRCECNPGDDCGCNTGSVVPDDRDGHCCSCSGLVDTGDGQCRCLSGRSKDVEGELFCGEDVLAVVDNDDDLKICESEKQIHQLQMEDIDLLPYMQYHSHGLLPDDQKVARKIVLESQHYEMINGVLHHENPNQPGRWCVVVPTKLCSQLLTEAHAGCFGGHFSEKKVYDKIRRNYWWYGLRRDVRKFCRSCLSCVTRQGPGHSY